MKLRGSVFYTIYDVLKPHWRNHSHAYWLIHREIQLGIHTIDTDISTQKNILISTGHTDQHTHKHACARTHTHIHACTHPQTHAPMLTYTHSRAEVHTHTHTHTHARANTNTNTHSHEQAGTPVLHTHTRPQPHLFKHKSQLIFKRFFYIPYWRKLYT